jgi:hypothetical protein
MVDMQRNRKMIIQHVILEGNPESKGTIRKLQRSSEGNMQ